MIGIRRALLLWMLSFLCACAPTQIEQTATSAPVPPGTPYLVTAWTENGNLYVWQTGDAFARRVASGGAIQPFVAPDGQHIAFTRGPAGAPESLWIISADGRSEQQLVGAGKPPAYGQSQMGQVLWWDASMLYFNTLKRASPASTPQHDLYRINITTQAVSLLLSPGEGGRISFSPSRSHIALVSAGDYDTQNGRIRIVDPMAKEPPVNLLFFTGVATGSHSGFYPPITWTSDETALIAAIPDKDLLYDEDSGEDMPETMLWHLPIAVPADRDIIGTIPASFFGMPRWSEDGSHMLYLERTGQETFRIMQADGDGENPFEIDSGKAGEIDMPTWIPGSTQFYYTKGTAGDLRIASLDELPRDLSPESVLMPHFVTPDRYVFMRPFNDIYDLRSAIVGQTEEQLISEIKSLAVFDAVWVTP